MRTQKLYIIISCTLLVGCTRYVYYCDFGTIYPTYTSLHIFQGNGDPQLTLDAYEITYDTRLNEKLSLANLFTLEVVNLEDSTTMEMYTGLQGTQSLSITVPHGLYSIRGNHLGHEPMEIDSMYLQDEMKYHLVVKFDSKTIVGK